MLTTLMTLSLLAIPPFASSADDGKASLQGAWLAQSMKADGNDAPPQAVERMKFTFQGDDLLLGGNFQNDKVQKCPYKVDATKTPKELDFTPPGAPKAVQGIYEIKGDEMRLCLRHASSSDGRPTEFASTPGSKLVLLVLKKQK